MTKTKRILAASALVLGLGSGLAWAAGIYPGFPSTTLPLTGTELFAVDTGLANGAAPQTENVTTNQMATWDAPLVTIPYASTETIDISQSKLFATTLTANATIANPTNLTSGKSFKLEVIQGGSGSYTVTWGSLFAWPAATAPTLSTSVGYVDLITCTYDGTKLRCSASLHVA